MQLQNKYKHLHYLICLGSELRVASDDIVSDALPEDMRAQLERLAAHRIAGDDAGCASEREVADAATEQR